MTTATDRRDRAVAARLGVHLTTAWLDYAGRTGKPLPPNNICWQSHADQVLAYMSGAPSTSLFAEDDEGEAGRARGA